MAGWEDRYTVWLDGRAGMAGALKEREKANGDKRKI